MMSRLAIMLLAAVVLTGCRPAESNRGVRSGPASHADIPRDIPEQLDRDAAQALWLPAGVRAEPRTQARAAQPKIRTITIAIAPVRDLTGQAHAHVPAFGDQIAAAVVKRGGVRVIYPHEFVAVAVRRSQSAAVVTDPPRAADTDTGLVEAAAHLEADAALVVSVLEYQPYYPPRVTLRARLYATAASDALDANKLLDMTDDGIPSDVPAGLRRQVIWAQETVFDGRDLSDDLQNHRTMRSMHRYLDYCARQLAAKTPLKAPSNEQ